jgi:hypothetical protein
VLEEGHNDVLLSAEEMEALFTWIDLNGEYYPEYECAYPDNPAGRSPLTFDELARLGNLTGIDFRQLGRHNRTLGPQISFERPEISPCLGGIEDPGMLREAISIIRKGQERLAEIPRADMEGFIPCEQHRAQLEKYEKRMRIESENLSAIREGRKRYDTQDNL